MQSASTGLSQLLAELSAGARSQQLNDSAWARLAGVPKESLSRLRQRQDCNWQTVERLAGALGMQLHAGPHRNAALQPDGHMPTTLDRSDEERLRQLSASGELAPAVWRTHGPAFFMAGLAVLLAGSRGFDRNGLLHLAETLHPGMSEPEVFGLWIKRTPLEPSRFFAQLDQETAHAARG